MLSSSRMATPAGLVILALLAATPIYAQNVGTVRGTVTSPDGEPLPGVLVQATGDVVRGERTSTTGATGEYLIPGLPPGLVAVTGTLEGLEPDTVEGVRVSISGVATVNLTMRPADVAEAITVTAEAPILDVTSSSVSTNYQAEMIDALPTTTRNYQEIALLAPGVNAIGRVGGVGEYQGFISAYGRDLGSLGWNVDGLAVAIPDDGAPFGGSIDPDTIADYQVLGAGAPAEYGNMTGVAINVVTKSGTNTSRGRLAYNGEWAETTATGPKVADGFGVERGFERVTYENYSLWSGGPIKKDKLFYFLSIGLRDDLMNSPGHTPSIDIPAGQADHYNLKVDWSINASHTLTGAYQWEEVARPSFSTTGGRVLANPNAVGIQQASGKPYVRFGYTGVVGAATLFEANWSDIYTVTHHTSATGSFESPFIDYNTSPQTSSGGLVYPYLYPVWWSRGHAKVTHFADDLAGSHEFKFGVQYSTSGQKAGAVFPGFGGKYYYKYGSNYYIYARGVHYYGAKAEAVGIYVDDSWRVTDRLTLNVGVRADQDGADLPSFPVLEEYLCNEIDCGVTVPGEFTPEYRDVVAYDSVDPRLGIAYRVGEGRRQGVLRASAGRYHEFNVTSMWQQPHPDRPPARNGSSPNRNGPFTYFAEVTEDDFGLPRKDLKRPQTDQFFVGYEQQLGDYTVGVQLVKHDTTDLIGWQLDDDGVYEDFAYVNPLTGETIMLKNIIETPTSRKGNAPGADANVPAGTKYEQHYQGAFLTFAKRHTGGWSVSSSLSWSETKGFQAQSANQNQGATFFISLDGKDPNNHLYGGGLGQADRPWVFRTQAQVDLPWQLKAVASFNYQDGRPYRHLARVRLNQGNVTIPLEPLTGDRRMPTNTNLDLGLSRRFLVGDRVGLVVDLQALNVLNDDTFYYWGGYGRYPAPLTPAQYTYPRRLAVRVGVDF